MLNIQSLLNPAAYPHSVQNIELIETHISWVLLTGQFAYKIKKPIQFDFLDFSTLEKRRFYCEEELRLNRRFAPELYIQVVAITEIEQQLKINGNGKTVEYAVQMRQFPTAHLLSSIAMQGDLSVSIIDQLSDVIANFHHHTAIDSSESCYGTAAEIHRWFLGNFAPLYSVLEKGTFLQQISQLESWGKSEFSKNLAFIEQRKQFGFVRECHGDLHLENIALLENQITPFDGIEFNPALRWIDVMNEVAFLVMDLQQRDKKQLAFRFLNRYLSQTGDYQGLRLLRYYSVYRALVRTKVALLRWQQHKNALDFAQAKHYADLAESFSTPARPLLLITHGYSGSGKSFFSTTAAETLGMIHIRSDVERQRWFSKPKQSADDINQGIYGAELTQQTYQKMSELAETLLDADFSVLIDATFLKASQRKLFQTLADEKGVKFLILDFSAPEEELQRRILQRQALKNDASEATLAVLQHQMNTAEPLSAGEQARVIQIESDEKKGLESKIKIFDNVIF